MTDDCPDLTNDEMLLEQLARLEHEQWMSWVGPLLTEERGISESRRKRWESYMVPYEKLPENIKEYDRIMARKVCKFLKFFCEKLEIACENVTPKPEE